MDEAGESFLLNSSIITQDYIGASWDGSADPTLERLGVAKMVSDFDLIYPWNQRKRVAMDTGGNVVGYHSSFDTNFWQDGSAVDWAEYETNGWNCMVQVPKFWYRQYKESGVWKFLISAHPKVGFYLHPAFYALNGDAKDYYYLSAFEGKVISSTLRSLPYYQPTTNVTMTNFITYAEENGKPIFEELVRKHQDRIIEEREKTQYSFKSRRRAINRLGLPEVKAYRLAKLELENKQLHIEMEKKEHIEPELKPLIIVHVQG